MKKSWIKHSKICINKYITLNWHHSSHILNDLLHCKVNRILQRNRVLDYDWWVSTEPWNSQRDYYTVWPALQNRENNQKGNTTCVSLSFWPPGRVKSKYNTDSKILVPIKSQGRQNQQTFKSGHQCLWSDMQIVGTFFPPLGSKRKQRHTCSLIILVIT